MNSSVLQLFPIDGQEFDTRSGRVTAKVTNNPDAPPSHGGFTDQVWFNLEFSSGKESNPNPLGDPPALPGWQ
jgi:hypothetical protein